jgi:hypothetical protein
LESTRARLEPAGWQVGAQVGNGTVSIIVEHPLSGCEMGFVLGRHDSEEARSAFLARCLNFREFSVVSTAPPEVPNAALLGKLRMNAMGSHWPPGVLRDVAGVLVVAEVITDAEYDWLATAEASWSEDPLGKA